MPTQYLAVHHSSDLGAGREIGLYIGERHHALREMQAFTGRVAMDNTDVRVSAVRDRNGELVGCLIHFTGHLSGKPEVALTYIKQTNEN